MSAHGVALRLARREVVRRPWRSLMVMLLVVVPVVALTALAVLVRTNHLTLEERFADRWGQADVAVRAGEAQLLDRFRSQIDGARTIAFHDDMVRLRTIDGQRSHANLTDVPVDDPMVDGMVVDLVGRAPASPDEALLSVPLAEALDVGIGDTVELTRPAEASFTVVGTARWRYELSRPVMVVGDGSDVVTDVARLGGREVASTMTLVDLPPAAESDPAVLAHLRASGVDNRLVAPWQDGGPTAGLAIVWSWVAGAVAFVIVGVVIAAAFAVTARRQLRLIGQLMSNGASERTLRATLVLQGSVIGVAGALAGIGLTLGGMVLGEPIVERLLDRRLDGYTVQLTDLIPVVVLATVAATVAALVPARTAVRTSVLQALAGRRPVGAYPNKLVARGALAVLGGLVLLAVSTAGASGADTGDDTWLFTLTGIGGAVAVILGTCAMSPAVVSRLEPLAGRLRGTTRLAARSVARQRSRTGAIVAAVAVVAAGAVAGSSVWLTAEADAATVERWEVPDDVVVIDYGIDTWSHDPYSHDSTELLERRRLHAPDEIVDQVLEVLPGAEVIRTATAVVPDGHTTTRPGPLDPVGDWRLQVVDGSTAAALDLAPELRDALDRHGLVGVRWEDGREVADGRVTLVDFDGNTYRTVDAATADAALAPTQLGGGGFVTRTTAEDLGLGIEAGPTVIVAPQRISDEQMDAIEDVRDDLYAEQAYGGSTGPPATDTSSDPVASRAPVHQPHVSVWTEYRTWEPSRSLVTAGIIGATTVLSLGVVALGLALSAAETKDERDVLAAIGARPRTLRRLAGAKAAVLAVAGTAIGVPLGFVPTWVVIRAGDIGGSGPPAVVFPWVQVALLVLVVPAVATLAAVAASGIALHLRPVQASSMAFD